MGDYVFSPNGKPIKVIEVHPKTMVDNCLEFSNGDKIICGDYHLWKVYDRVKRKYSLLETQQIMKRKLKQGKANKTNTFTIDIVEPLEFPKKEVPIDPYWLGLWLGDGHHKRPTITLHKNDIITTESTPYEVIRYNKNEGDCVEAVYTHQGLTEKLRELNIYGNKHIPDLYLYNSVDVRMQLLAGLIDSDGCVEKERNRIIFSNTNKKLLKQVYNLFVSLGFKVSVGKQTANEQNEYKKHCKTNYHIITKDIYYLRTYAHKSIPTKLPRKQVKNKKQYRIGLTNAYKVKSVEGNCITVESDDGLYLVGKHLTITHNSKSSMVTLAFPLWILFQDPNTNIMIVTGSPKLAEKFGIQLREYVRELGSYFNVYLSNVKQASTHIMFCDKNGKLYRGNIMLASSGGGITGQDADYLILDDPYTGNDSEFTPTALQQKIDWVNRVVEQRIEPHTKYCVLHTRWHDLSKDTPVYTVNKGWITHGELEVGDTLLGTNRKHTKVVKVHPTTQCNNVLVFSNGDRIVCGDEHLWKFHNSNTNTTQIYTTYNVMQEELHKPYNYENVFTIPVSKSKCIALIDAYKLDKPQASNCITVDSPDGMYLVGKNLTPTHNSNDIIGYYKETEPDLYDFVEFPAINEDGEVLWKERYSKEEILKKKEIVGERVFESVYQQKPIDLTSDFFNIPNLKFGLPENYVSQQTVRAWDIAASDVTTRNDFTAGIRAHRFDDYFIIDDLVHGRFGNQVNQIIKTTAMSDTPNVKIYIETGVGNAKLLYEEWKNQLQGYIVERAEVSGRGSKADRATPFKNALEDGRVYINISDPTIRQVILDELKGFPFMTHDDIVDSIAHCYNALFMSDKLGRKVNARIEAINLNW